MTTGRNQPAPPNHPPQADATTAPYIYTVHVRNYKSIGEATVALPTFCVLVGPNGAGKSNFVDALSFVTDCLADSVELAFQNRGGLAAVRRRSAGHPTHVGIRLLVSLPGGTLADYAFEIASKRPERFTIATERCVLKPPFGAEISFDVANGEFKRQIPGIRPKVRADRLALFAASATDEFRPLYDFLVGMRFYSLAPDRMRELQEPNPGNSLSRDGGNAAAVLKRLRDEAPDRYERLCSLVSKAVPGVSNVDYHFVGRRDTMKFKQDVGLQYPWTFDALNMSDGTLRLLGVLLAVYQPSEPTLVAIEEPEATVHPGITELLVQVLLDESQRRQILLTTHSPDILDYKYIDPTQVRVVTSERGDSLISPLSASSRESIRARLYTPGELLRIGELAPDVAEARRLARQLQLFTPPAGEPVPNA